MSMILVPAYPLDAKTRAAASSSCTRSGSSSSLRLAEPSGMAEEARRPISGGFGGGGRRGAVGRHGVQLDVLLGGVDPVLVLDDADLLELGTQPTVAGIEQAELLDVGHDLREEHGLEHLLPRVRVLGHPLDDDLRVLPQPLPDLRREEAVAQGERGFEGELLTFADLVAVQSLVELLERQHPEGHVAGLVTHDVAEQLLEEWLLGQKMLG